jgi:hypothetical protein
MTTSDDRIEDLTVNWTPEVAVMAVAVAGVDIATAHA